MSQNDNILDTNMQVSVVRLETNTNTFIEVQHFEQRTLLAMIDLH